MKITIPSDLDAFQYCSHLREVPQHQVPINRGILPSTSSSYVDPSMLSKSTTTFTPPVNPKVQIQDKGCYEYKIASLYCIRKLPTSPKSWGKPGPILPKQTILATPTTFTKWGELSKEDVSEDISTWLYKEEDEVEHIKLPLEQYGKGYEFVKQQGYHGHGGLRPNRNGWTEPLQPTMRPRNKGLGYTSRRANAPHTKLLLGRDASTSKDVETSIDPPEPEPESSHPKLPNGIAWINIFWDLDNTSICTLTPISLSFLDTDDGLPLVHPELIDWD